MYDVIVTGFAILVCLFIVLIYTLVVEARIQNTTKEILDGAVEQFARLVNTPVDIRS